MLISDSWSMWKIFKKHNLKKKMPKITLCQAPIYRNQHVSYWSYISSFENLTTFSKLKIIILWYVWISFSFVRFVLAEASRVSFLVFVLVSTLTYKGTRVNHLVHPCSCFLSSNLIKKSHVNENDMLFHSSTTLICSLAAYGFLAYCQLFHWSIS